ncbi:MAG TPA: hypothetical protein ENN22_07370 [bacterium]|nr:hypothetical protein [bacterium]
MMKNYIMLFIKLLLFLFVIFVRAFSQSYNVRIPDVIVNSSQNQIEIPIIVSEDLTGQNITAWQGIINWDNSVIQYAGHEHSGTLTEGWGNTGWTENHTTGQLNFGQYVASPPLEGSGTLVILIFDVVGNVGDVTDINFDQFYLNAIEASTTNGSVTLVTTPDETPPAAITNLAVSATTVNSATLTWTAPGDDGDDGVAATYDIRYSTSPIDEENWDSATQATDEPTPQESGSIETFTVAGLTQNTTYYFAIKAADEMPNWSELSNVASGTTLDEGWSVVLTITGDGATITRTFGGAASGTDGFDSGLDVVTPPPGQTYYTYWSIPSFPNYLGTDIRYWQAPFEEDIDWTLKITNAEEITTTINWNPDGLPSEGNFILMGASSYDMRETSSITFTGNRSLTIQYQAMVCLSYSFSQQGWYMVSLPVIPVDNRVSTLFPTALGHMAFAWDAAGGAYNVVDRMDPQKGYWLAIPGATSDQVCGLPLYSYTEHWYIKVNRKIK